MSFVLKLSHSAIVSWVVLLLATTSRASEITSERVQRLEQALEEQRIDARTVGMSFALVQGDEVLLSRGYGHRDLSASLDADEHTLFAIGSCTKAFTSMLIALLIDEGKMGWDDAVQIHVKEFGLRDVTANPFVTLRDLLCHRTGLCRQSVLWCGGDATPEQILPRVRHAQLFQPFRRTFQYNNVMFLTAGVASARVAGTTWEELLQYRLFDPLEMTRSNAFASETLADANHSVGYGEESGQPVALPLRDIRNCGPAGSIYSSAQEMTHWLRFLLAQGRWKGQQLVQEMRLREMWQTQDSDLGPMPYGLGWFVREWQGKKVVEHGGNIDGFSAQVGLMPEEELGFVLLTNASRTPIQQSVLELVWSTLLTDSPPASGERPGRPGPPQSLAQMQPLTGRYDFPMADGDFLVAIDGDQLTIEVPGQGALPLQWPDREGRWALPLAGPEVWVSFDKTDTGYVESVTLHQGGDLRMDRIEEEAPLPTTLDELMLLVSEAYDFDRAEELLPFVIRGSISYVHQGLTGDLTIYVEDASRWDRIHDFGEFGTERIHVDGDEGWSDLMLQGRKEYSGADVEILRMQSPLALFGDWFLVFEDVEVDRADTLDDTEVIVAKIWGTDRRFVTRRIDAETGLVLQEIGSEASSPPILFEDYRSVEGVMIPFRQSLEIPGHGTLVAEFEQVESGAELPEDFAEPAQR